MRTRAGALLEAAVATFTTTEFLVGAEKGDEEIGYSKFEADTCSVIDAQSYHKQRSPVPRLHQSPARRNHSRDFGTGYQRRAQPALTGAEHGRQY